MARGKRGPDPLPDPGEGKKAAREFLAKRRDSVEIEILEGTAKEAWALTRAQSRPRQDDLVRRRAQENLYDAAYALKSAINAFAMVAPDLGNPVGHPDYFPRMIAEIDRLGAWVDPRRDPVMKRARHMFERLGPFGGFVHVLEVQLSKFYRAGLPKISPREIHALAVLAGVPDNAADPHDEWKKRVRRARKTGIAVLRLLNLPEADPETRGASHRRKRGS